MADHVSFVRMKALPGKRDAIVEQLNKWDREQKSKAKGFIRSVMASGNDDPDAIMGVVRWDNTDNYVANASRPEQDAWYQGLRANLASDPEWFDATVVGEWKA